MFREKTNLGISVHDILEVEDRVGLQRVWPLFTTGIKVQRLGWRAQEFFVSAGTKGGVLVCQSGEEGSTGVRDRNLEGR